MLDSTISGGSGEKTRTRGRNHGFSLWSGSGADLPMKARPMVAPVSVWTGFYAGLNVGYGWGNVGSSNDPGDPASQNLFNSPFAPVFGPNDFRSSFRQVGIIAGGQAGYNWQFAGRGILGFEADFQYSEVGGRDRHVAFLDPAVFGNSFTFNSVGARRLDWFGTIRGRLGFLVTPSILLYGTGGLAYGETNSRGEIALTAANSSVSFSSGTSEFSCSNQTSPSVVCYSGSSTDIQTGWTAGAGGEWKFASNWSAKLEYLRVELPSTAARLTSPPPSTPDVNTNFRFNRQAYDFVRVGVNYQFGGGPIFANR